MQKKVFTRECKEIIWEDEPKDDCWAVLFPQCGDKEDIADLYMKEEDLKRIPAMSADVNEQIKAQFDSLEKGKKAEDCFRLYDMIFVFRQQGNDLPSCPRCTPLLFFSQRRRGAPCTV